MKRYRPRCAGYYVLYALAAICLGDAVYTAVKSLNGTVNAYMSGFSLFSYLILAFAAAFVWMYARAQVCVGNGRMRIAYPATIQPREGEPRAAFIYRQGSLDLRFIDKTFELASIVRYGYVEDLGYKRLDQSNAGERNKLFPVREVAFVTEDGKRYHLNAAIFSAAQRREIFARVRDGAGKPPEGKLAETLEG